jgi:hypothetical protein
MPPDQDEARNEGKTQSDPLLPATREDGTRLARFFRIDGDGSLRTLDGKLVGRWEGVTLPGRTAIIARRRGFRWTAMLDEPPPTGEDGRIVLLRVDPPPKD